MTAGVTAFGCAAGSEDTIVDVPQGDASSGGDTSAEADGSDASASDVADVAVDKSSVDAKPDVDADAKADAGCTQDADCTGSPSGGVCDTTTGKCVGCLASNDTCPTGQFCDAQTSKCEAGCKSTADCDPNAADAGADGGDAGDAAADGGDAGVLVCDTQVHQCVGCIADADCPAGTVCDTPSHSCIAGCTAQHACQAGRDCCAGACLDTSKDIANCGACGNKCPTPAHGTAACANSQCGIDQCDPNWGDCNASAVDGCEANLNTSTSNCGACAQPCAPSHAIGACAAGLCQVTVCASGWADCNLVPVDGCEVDTTADPLHCGSCATPCKVSNGTPVCNIGSCEVASCKVGYDDCDGVYSNGCETNLNTNAQNCGTCNKSCTLTNPNGICVAGQCSVGLCAAPLKDCDGNPANGCEINSSNDVANCGNCGFACTFPNANASCVSSTCTMGACATGYGDCDNLTSTGCETNLKNDINNCSGCGVLCKLSHASATCTNGACGIFQCTAPFENCNAADFDGCEADLSSSTNNCGACGTKCTLANATAACTSSKCTIAQCTSGYADCNTTPADGCEINVQGDATNCGTCGTKCTAANATATCGSGACKVGTCNPGYKDCDTNYSNGCEVNVLTDGQNCGACGQACTIPNAAASCSNGACSLTSCNSGFQNCNGLLSDGCETNLKTAANCGACGQACVTPNATPTCNTGTCAIQTCDAGFTDCNGQAADGCEVNTATDVTHCGGCAVTCAVANGLSACTASTCGVAGCNPGFANCDNQYSNGCEVNTKTDVANCGACGAACNLPHVQTTTCAAGACGIVACATGWGDCNGTASDGCETQLNSLTNCGTCGSGCTVSNGVASCSTGTCTISSCSAGWKDCDGSAANGCEVNLETDTKNCAACGTVCPAVGGATPNCVAGVCGVSNCPAGTGDCNGIATDGCETTTTNNVQACGACGATCNVSNGTPKCTNTTCGVGSCTAGFADCDGNYANGCETGLKTNTNCGACGSVCAPQNATATCSTGACAVQACNTGFADCNVSAADGCEVNTATSITSCGACGNVCSNVNGTPSCTAGACAIACGAGFGNCDGNVGNGCETNTSTSPVNCGACGNVCSTANGTATCATGKCGIVCAAGFGDCNTSATDGCETPLNTVTSCGACGVACAPPNATGSCTTGTCAIAACNGGFADCDGNPANGCEVNLKTDPTHCGTCSTACNATHGAATCTAGVCGITCAAGYGDCDGTATNGCETATTNNVNDCGACGTVCSASNGSATCAGTTCQVGTCNAGFADCDGLYSTGCETSLKTNTNCGTCGSVCGPANATGNCSTGVCSIQTCNSGFADCNAKDSDGCEVNIGSNVSNCGACGNVCNSSNGTASCAGGVCAIGCSAGFANCDGLLSNGCETNTNTNTANCGGCGTVCNSTNGASTCSNGACGIVCSAGFGNCDSNLANGCETSLTTTSNCGTCGTVCSAANGSVACTSGACTVSACNAGFANCDGVYSNGCETSLKSNTDCGACGVACAPANSTGTCATGTCAIQACSGTYANCDGLVSNGCETNTNTNLSNCGACGNACSAVNDTPSCTLGVCSITCTAGYANCDANVANGCETNLQTNLNNCGACGTACSTVNDTPSCAAGACSVACTAGFGNCNGLVADGCEASLKTLTNCGTCGSACAPANSTASCSTGTCAISSCNAGYTNCDGLLSNGCEVNTAADTAHCGTCTTACTVANGAPSCTSGACGVGSCNAGFANCDGVYSNGCEINLKSDPANCNACGSACSLPNVGTNTCTSGACTIGACASGWGNCDGSTPNGCETALTTTANCGSCGTACTTPNATASCSTGTCAVSTCNAGFANCDGNVANGCEVNTQTDVNNCATCGHVCSAGGATPNCVAGVCGIASCPAGFGDCDGNSANGCETAITNNVSACGSCGSVCSVANGTPKCTNTTCGVSACNAGFADCNGTYADGCETNLKTTANCGGCGTVCAPSNATGTCSSGTCAVLSCAAGFADCNGLVSDGCEVNTASSTSNCGSCGAVCSASGGTPSCTNGSCGIVCSAGFANCDSSVANGCEVNTNTSTGNCGGCGNACSTNHGTASCTAGACGIACSAGYGNCTGGVADGCETQLNTTTNCGGCGTACAPANASGSCTTGACAIATCNAGYTNCDNAVANGCEINTAADTNNCGTCGTVCNLANATAKCSAGACAINACNAGFADCDGNPANGCETNITTSTGNCGGCGVACSTNNITTATCSAGVCTGACNAGFADCNGNKQTDGCEVNLQTNANSCGSCTNSCSSTNMATRTCSAGVCNGTCAAGFADCNSNKLTDGCEVNTQTSASNCGACGTVCSTNNVTSATCSAGTCNGTCSAGFADCNNNKQTDGCEVNTQTSASNCGACGAVCSGNNIASPTCAAGTCNGTCNAGFADCNANKRTDGCEISTTNNVNNCGGCGTICSVANGSPACVASACTIASCSAGFGNCNGLYADGCEVNTTSSATNCGACGAACSQNHATETCASSACSLSSCAAGYQNCNGLLSDGCEIGTTSDINNCGGCGNVCSSNNGTPGCVGSACTISCAAGFQNCNGQVTDGCEINTTNNASNCGSCGTVCSNNHISPSCGASVCNGTCAAGYADCNNNKQTDGCEISLTTDANNCGACNNNCNTLAHPNAAGVACSSSVCTITSCSPNYYNTDGTFSDGCECLADSIPDACGTAQQVTPNPLPLAGTTSVSGNITPGTDVDFFIVNFTGANACGYHPKVVLQDSSGKLRFDIQTDCNASPGAMTCNGSGESGSSVGLAGTWEFTYNVACGSQQSADPGLYPSSPTTIYIKVYQSSPQNNASCLPYTVQITN